jgi:uncharacterized protein YjdB
MKKRLLAALLTLVLVLSVAPTVSLAAQHTITSNGTYKLSDYGSGSKIVIKAVSVVLLGEQGKEYANVQIVCEKPVRLALNNVNIRNTTADLCALSFTGTGNTLTLQNSNTLISGSGQPGVKAEGDTSLYITGGGNLTAEGGMYAAGIGGSDQKSGGKITIVGTTVTATGGQNGAQDSNSNHNHSGAGIGGGKEASGGMVSIMNATVSATGGHGAAGIGSGCNLLKYDRIVTGGFISISSGTVTAQGGMYAAGIGGSFSSGSGSYSSSSPYNDSTSGEIIITGGTVRATGGRYGSGIGAGYNGTTDMVRIYGGTIYATGIYAPGIGDTHSSSKNSTLEISGGQIYAHGSDFGCGIQLKSSNAYFELSGNAYIIGNRDYAGMNPASTTHIMERYLRKLQGSVFGLPVPEGWDSVSAYILPVTLTYNAGSGWGERIDTYHTGGQAIVGDGSSMWNGILVVKSWNTALDGSGVSYPIGSTFTIDSDITLYAEWDTQPVTEVILSSREQTLNTGDSVKLTATVQPANASYPLVTWASSNPAVATVTKSGVVTAVKAGSADITATADGVSGTCAVTVNQLAQGVMVLPSSQTLSVGATAALSVIVAPEDTSNPSVTWSTSNAAVAKVNSKGVVTGVSAGKAVITAAANGFFDTCEVDVSGVMINLKLSVGSSMDLSAAVAQSGEIVWKSSNETVALVDEDGIVIAVGVGSAIITLKSDSGIQSVGILVVKPSAVANSGSANTSGIANSADNTSADFVGLASVDADAGNQDGTVTAVIDMDTMPDDTQAIRLSCGEVIDVGGTRSRVAFQVSEADVADDGMIELAALSGKGDTQNGYALVVPGVPETAAVSSSGETPVLIWVLVILLSAALGAAATAVLFRRSRAIKNP